MKYYVVDAFTDEIFKGNSAGVCLLESELSSEIMQKIAFENNLAETAFIFKKSDSKIYCLKWFTPDVEIDLCGHATLAAAFVLMNFVEKDLKSVDFLSKSGMLNVIRDGKFYKLNFPSRMPKLEAHNPLFEQALGVKVLETHLSRDFLVVVENENIVKNLKPNFKLLSKISQKISFGVIVTAKGDSCDFVSRFFLPNATIVEDPVTGSTHCSLIPFWSKRLNKTSMLAKQLSIRGGTLICEDLGERVNISGQAICYLTGKIKI